MQWFAISHSRGSSQPRDGIHVSYVSCIGREVLDHLSYQGSPLKPFSGINSRWSRDSNVKGEATGSLEANVECIHLLDAGKALREAVTSEGNIDHCRYIKLPVHQKRPSKERKQAQGWEEIFTTHKTDEACVSELQGLHEEHWRGLRQSPGQLRGCMRWAQSQFPCTSAGITAKLESHGKCLHAGLSGEGWRRGRTNSSQNVNF